MAPAGLYTAVPLFHGPARGVNRSFIPATVPDKQPERRGRVGSAENGPTGLFTQARESTAPVGPWQRKNAPATAGISLRHALRPIPHQYCKFCGI